VWAKVRGFDWWPARRVGLSRVPHEAARAKVAAARAEASAKSRLVFFFGEPNYGWVEPEDLLPWAGRDAGASAPKGGKAGSKKAGGRAQAYRQAVAQAEEASRRQAAGEDDPFDLPGDNADEEDAEFREETGPLPECAAGDVLALVRGGALDWGALADALARQDAAVVVARRLRMRRVHQGWKEREAAEKAEKAARKKREEERAAKQADKEDQRAAKEAYLTASKQALKDAQRATKQDEKDRLRAAKQAEKEEQKAAKKAEKEEEMAVKKAEKEQEKAAKKAEKEQEKLAKKAEKEEQRAAKKAEKAALKSKVPKPAKAKAKAKALVVPGKDARRALETLRQMARDPASVDHVASAEPCALLLKRREEQLLPPIDWDAIAPKLIDDDDSEDEHMGEAEATKPKHKRLRKKEGDKASPLAKRAKKEGGAGKGASAKASAGAAPKVRMPAVKPAVKPPPSRAELVDTRREVFVSFPPGASMGLAETKLKIAFGRYGIESVKIVQPERYASLLFSKGSDAALAMKNLKGNVMNNKDITMSLERPKSAGRGASAGMGVPRGAPAGRFGGGPPPPGMRPGMPRQGMGAPASGRSPSLPLMRAQQPAPPMGGGAPPALQQQAARPAPPPPPMGGMPSQFPLMALQQQMQQQGGRPPPPLPAGAAPPVGAPPPPPPPRMGVPMPNQGATPQLDSGALANLLKSFGGGGLPSR